MNKTICLNMIVKDESLVIQRCLSSIIEWIDYWVIIDTGSTDRTQQIIRDYLKHIPGELHEHPWVDFAFNRNEALSFAKKKRLSSIDGCGSIFIPKEPGKSDFRHERKLPRINDRRLRKLSRIIAIRTNLRSSIIGALAKPKSRFSRFFGYSHRRFVCDARPV
jgi:glycosyltransferase involved in cell wall biosynthesis